jgi:hypothetical protein
MLVSVQISKIREPIYVAVGCGRVCSGKVDGHHFGGANRCVFSYSFSRSTKAPGVLALLLLFIVTDALLKFV